MLKIYLSAVVALGAMWLGPAKPTQASIFIKLDPSATYLRTNNDDAPGATPVALASLPFAVNAGDYLRLTRVGDFSFFSSPDEIGLNLLAVFSSSDTLLASSNVKRVEGALNAGSDVFTGPTWFDNLPNDIDEDFFVPGLGNSPTSVVVKVPVGAAYLFFSSHDSFYHDNVDPNGDYGVSIDVASEPLHNPEPSSLLVFAVGGATVVLLRRFGTRPGSAA